jgi:thiamine biosynthesis protein ThiS
MPPLDILVNGAPATCPEGASVEDLLLHLDLPRARVAVERNRRIVRRDERASTRVESGDAYEIVTFVGGG